MNPTTRPEHAAVVAFRARRSDARTGYRQLPTDARTALADNLATDLIAVHTRHAPLLAALAHAETTVAQLHARATATVSTLDRLAHDAVTAVHLGLRPDPHPAPTLPDPPRIRITDATYLRELTELHDTYIQARDAVPATVARERRRTLRTLTAHATPTAGPDLPTGHDIATVILTRTRARAAGPGAPSSGTRTARSWCRVGDHRTCALSVLLAGDPFATHLPDPGAPAVARPAETRLTRWGPTPATVTLAIYCSGDPATAATLYLALHAYLTASQTVFTPSPLVGTPGGGTTLRVTHRAPDSKSVTALLCALTTWLETEAPGPVDTRNWTFIVE